MGAFPMRVSPEEAAKIFSKIVRAVEKETIQLDDSLGRTLAEEISADEDLPPFDRSPYDGYAVRTEDLANAGKNQPVTLKIVAEIPAGSTWNGCLQRGEAVKILTGAPVPSGADAVIRYEDTEYTEKCVRIFSPLPSGSNIVRRGEDIAIGEKVAFAGTVITPALLGVMAGLGHASVRVFRKPRITLISTGDELLEPESPLEAGKIRNSSALFLSGFLKERGMEVRTFGIVADDEKKIAEAISAAAETSDLVITTGGASVGDYDFVLAALEQLGAQIHFWKVRMKPGMATLAATYKGVPVLGLSGNPSSAAAALFATAIPALKKMSGKKQQEMPKVQVILRDGFKKKSPSGRFLPGKMVFEQGRVCLDISRKQANGIISSWEECSMIGIIPQDSPALPPESIIDAWYVGDCLA